MPSPELKPCPFCGSSNVEANAYTDDWDAICDVRCRNCKALMSRTFYNSSDCHEVRKEAVAAWNRRAEGGPNV